ncbi:4-oxalocrotonate tautomerase family protein [Nonomuraea sp. NPDC049400]|uniref:4-oxalocrotonate tautomerase family protein n=1 Tax=Nonomuraea sp. NPDC049400 TaxID=3364352 RepID=UPI00379E9498
MTVITVTAPAGRLTGEQRRRLARTLTDAVLVPEVGRFVEAARVGFQVHFAESAPDMMAIGGVLLSDSGADAMHIDVAVMEADWAPDVRADVITRVLAAMAEACGLEQAPPGWWVNFRVIEEGSWGSRGGVLSILDLLDSGVFSAERAEAIRKQLL